LSVLDVSEKVLGTEIRVTNINEKIVTHEIWARSFCDSRVKLLPDLIFAITGKIRFNNKSRMIKRDVKKINISLVGDDRMYLCAR
jgi:hypothetical protein